MGALPETTSAGLPAFPAAGLAELQRQSMRIGGREKAAILLVSLGPERAADVFRHLKDEEIEALSLEMAKTRQVPQDTS
ncbi:MAG: flagellar motor switch protein FliG, partial [Solirubrobacteraceae bacterium]|nr:flagellar motor switch protein FliG [Solirubrobacteraceae bacterium]